MRGIVYNNELVAGIIEKDSTDSYVFRYDDKYFVNPANPPISLTLAKNRQEYHSNKMFPFFYGLLSEGVNKDIQCRLFKIDENDDFTRLLLTTRYDTIGAITVKPEDDEMFRLLY